MSSSYYIVLTSDVRRDQYPKSIAADVMMQLTSQLNPSEDWEVAMTRIIYVYSWRNVREHQRSYTLLCKTSGLPWTLTIYPPSGIYCTVKDIIRGMLRGLQNGLRDSYLKGKKTVTSVGGNRCFYINEKAQYFFELKLPPGWFVTLPKTLACTLGYLNH